MPRLIAVCDAAFDGRWPQVLLYGTSDGRFAAGLWWPVPGGRIIAEPRGGLRAEALWMAASSPDPTDLPELLAIVRSARLRRP